MTQQHNDDVVIEAIKKANENLAPDTHVCFVIQQDVVHIAEYGGCTAGKSVFIKQDPTTTEKQ